MMRFQGKVALVTGAGAGIGRAIAHRLAGEGAAVAVLEQDPRRAEACAAAIVATGGRALAIVVDVAEEGPLGKAVAAARDKLGPIDIAVANTAATTRGTVKATSSADFDLEIKGTLKAPFLLAKAVLPAMEERGRGVFIAIGSINGHLVLGNPVYSAAKAGLLNLVRSIAWEYGPKGIRANVVSPGTVRTDHPSWAERQKRDPQVFEKLDRLYPVGRIGRPDDIAGAVAYLASDDAAFVTGAELIADGGLSIANSQFIETASGRD